MNIELHILSTWTVSWPTSRSAATTCSWRAYKNTPDYVSKWSRARVEKLNLGGPSGLLLSWC